MTLYELLNGVGAEAALGLGVVLITGAVGVGRWLISRLERSLDARFSLIDQSRQEGQTLWRETFQAHLQTESREFETLRNLDREFMRFRADLPTLYIRRDELRDYLTRLDMRFETINDKLNRLLPPSALDAPPNEPHASSL